MEFDEVFKYIGEFGIYQIILYMLLGIPSFFPGYQSISMTFIAATPEHWCKVDRLDNFTHEQQQYIAIPYDDGGDYKRCEYWNHSYNAYTDEELVNWDRWANNDSSEMTCDQWVYDKSEFYSTVTEEWDLVCDDSYKVSLISTFYLLGIFFGAPLSGAVSDKFGRFPSLIIFTVLHFVFALVPIYAQNYATFVVLRFFMSVFNAGAYLTAFVIVMEVIGPRYRTMAGIVYQMFFSLGFMVLPGMAYFVRDHIKLQYTMAIPVLATLGYIWIIPESPRWLLANNKEKEAVAILSKIAAVNGRVLPNDIRLSDKDPNAPEVEKGTFGDILRHPLLRKELFVMYLAWFTNSLVYYGLSLNTSSLVGSVYLNTFLSGLVEVPANLLCILLMYKVGRKPTLVGGFLFGGAACLLCIPFFDNEGLGWLVTTFTMLGKAAITMTFSVVYVYTAELFPSPVRQLAVGSSSMMARVSGLAAPFMGDPLMAIWTGLPSLIFGLFAMMSGIVAIMLPETLGQPLPDTIQDAEEIGRAKKSKKSEKQRPEDTNVFAADNKAFEADSKLSYDEGMTQL